MNTVDFVYGYFKYFAKKIAEAFFCYSQHKICKLQVNNKLKHSYSGWRIHK